MTDRLPPAPPEPRHQRTAGDVVFYVLVVAYLIVAAIAGLLALGIHAGIAVGF